MMPDGRCGAVGNAGEVDIVCRPALAADKPAMWELYESALKPHIDTIWGWDAAWQCADFERACAAATTSIVLVEGGFAGYVQVDEGASADYLSMLILAPAYRSAGIGARLLAGALQASRQRGRALTLRVFRTNAAAQRFYEREGWHVTAVQGDFIAMAHAG